MTLTPNSIIGKQLLAGYIAANLYIDSDRLQPQSVFRQVHVQLRYVLELYIQLTSSHSHCVQLQLNGVATSPTYTAHHTLLDSTLSCKIYTQGRYGRQALLHHHQIDFMTYNTSSRSSQLVCHTTVYAAYSVQLRRYVPCASFVLWLFAASPRP